MKKIGIITFHSAYNYGSALQATALQLFLEKLGYQVDILNFRDQLDLRQYKLFRTHYYFFPPIILEDIRSYSNNKARINSYEEYRQNYMNITDKCFYSDDELKDIADDYDAFICGSDQIWNTSCTRGAKKPYYLNFAKDSKALRMSYAPSIAHSSVEEKYIEEFKTELKNIQVMSIREETGRKIIQELTGINPEVVLDPTLLLDAFDYERMMKPMDTHGKFVYAYCLEYNKEVYDYAYQLAQKNGYQLIYFSKTDKIRFKNCINSFPYSPSEFLYLIKNAEFVVTNSFHATVFSILFEKKFTTFTTKRSSSRMVDFLTKLGIEDRIYHKDINMSKEINYENVKHLLNELKVSSMDFLKTNLDKYLGENK